MPKVGAAMGTADIQGELWSAKAHDWAYLFEPMSAPLWVAMLDSAGVQKGTRFADLGCGGGGASLLAFRRGAQVSGLDASDALIAIARDRIASGDFRVGDLESLPFQDNSFDVTMCSLALMFVHDIPKALSEMKRVTVAGGRIAVGVWGAPKDCEYRHILSAIASTLPASPSGSGPFSLSQGTRLENLMQDADLRLLTSGAVAAPFQFANPHIMLRMVGSVGPMQAAKQQVDESILERAILQAAQPYQQTSGQIVFNNRLKYVTASV